MTDSSDHKMSNILLGILGFVIVMSFIIGGMFAGGLLQASLTPDVGFFYPVWLWVGLMPCAWLMVRTGLADRVKHPVKAYAALLPLALITGVPFHYFFELMDEAHRTLIDKLGLENPWTFVFMFCFVIVAASILTQALDFLARVYDVVRRKSTPLSNWLLAVTFVFAIFAGLVSVILIGLFRSI